MTQPFDQYPDMSLAQASGAIPMASAPPPLATMMPRSLAAASMPPTSAAAPVASGIPEPNFSGASGVPQFAAPPDVPPMSPMTTAAPVAPQPQPSRQPVGFAASRGGMGTAAAYRRGAETATQRAVGSYDQRKAATAEGSDAAYKAGQDIAAVQAGMGDQHRAWAAADQIAAYKRSQELGAVDRDWNEKMRARSGMKIDPYRDMPRGVAADVFGAIGAMLGGAAQAMTGHNTFMDQINASLDRAERTQRGNIAAADDELAQIDQRGAGVMRKAQFEDAQRLASRAQKLEGLKSYLSSIATQSESAQVKANAKDAMAQLTNEQERMRAQYLGGMATHLEARDAANSPYAQAMRAIQLKKGLADANNAEAQVGKTEAEAAAKRAEPGANAGKTLVKPLGVHVANENLVKDVTKASDAIDRTLNAVGRIRALMKSGNRLSPEDRGRVSQAARELVISEKDRNELGQLTGGDWGLMPTSPDTVNDWIRTGQTGALDELENFARSSRSRLIENYGVTDDAGNKIERSSTPGKLPDSLVKVK